MGAVVPRVSAIITTFNRASYCKEAITSVLAQEYTDFELLVLDNSSSDNTEEVVQSFHDARIRYIRHPQLTIAAARNLGWQSARGEFIAYLDDDDRWLPHKLSAELAAFESGSDVVALTYGGFYKINNQGRRVGVHHPTLTGSILVPLLEQRDDFTGSASNPMVRRSALEILGGYNATVVTGEDYELYLRLAEKYTVAYTSEIVLEIRMHAGPRLGDKLREAAQLELMIMERYRSVFDQNPKLKSFYFQKIGGKYCRIGLGRDGRAYFQKAIRIHPSNFAIYIQYVGSYLGTTLYKIMHAVYQKFRAGK